MKKYQVSRVFSISSINPSVVFTTDIKEDAIAYAEIMHRNDGNEYAVTELVATIGGQSNGNE